MKTALLKDLVPGLLFAALSGLALSGCARGPNITSEELPLKKVVVYRNGIAYFERAGDVDSDHVTFKMRGSMVGDFLATLAIVEKGGSSVRAASFPLKVDGSEVSAPCPPPGEICPPMPYGPPAPPAQVKDKDPLRDVVLELDGENHRLLVGYVSETPVWRPSYRVVVQPNGQALLQAWGIVQNLSGEDWNDVELTLVAGAPIAFQSTLGDSVIPPRPIVSDQGEVIQQVPEGSTSLAELAPAEAPAPAPPMTEPEESMADEGEASMGTSANQKAAPQRMRAERSVKKTDSGTSVPASASVMGGMGRGVSMANLGQSSGAFNPLASVAVQGGNTEYVLPNRVTVPDKSATMVLLLNQSIPGEAVFLFAPDPGVPDSVSHPFRVARFTNTTKGLLEKGPIAVFEHGAFLGQGVLEPLPTSAKATVPFALDRSIALQTEHRYDQRDAQLYRIEASQLFIERQSITETIYTIKNGGDKAARLLVKHPRMAETALENPPQGTEDNVGTGTALVPAAVAAKAQAKLTVTESRPNTQHVDWLEPLADLAVQSYLKHPKRDFKVAEKLTAAWAIRTKLRALIDEQQSLNTQQDEQQRALDELRRSLKAIEKNTQAADLRTKLTARLADTSQRYDAISRRLVELGMLLNEQQVRFRDAISEIKLPAQQLK